jgi:hypothetical protein
MEKSSRYELSNWQVESDPGRIPPLLREGNVCGLLIATRACYTAVSLRPLEAGRPPGLSILEKLSDIRETVRHGCQCCERRLIIWVDLDVINTGTTATQIFRVRGWFKVLYIRNMRSLVTLVSLRMKEEGDNCTCCLPVNTIYRFLTMVYDVKVKLSP